MAIELKQISIAKEVDDVLALVVEIIKNRQKGEALAQLVDEFMAAIVGADKIPSELSLNRKAVMQTVGIRVAEITDALLGA